MSKRKGHGKRKQQAGRTSTVVVGVPFRVDTERFTAEQGLILQLERGFHRHPQTLVIRIAAEDIVCHVRPIGTEFDTERDAHDALQRFADRHSVDILIDGRAGIVTR